MFLTVLPSDAIPPGQPSLGFKREIIGGGTIYPSCKGCSNGIYFPLKVMGYNPPTTVPSCAANSSFLSIETRQAG